MNEKEKKKSKTVMVIKSKEKEKPDKKDQEANIDLKDWRKDQEVQYFSNIYDSGWSCIM